MVSAKNCLMSSKPCARLAWLMRSSAGLTSPSPGRASYDYPDEVTQLEAQLKALKETAVETGKATAKPSKPFWTIRPPKS